MIRIAAVLIPFFALSVDSLADFPTPFNTEPVSEDSWMKPDEAAAKMSAPEGFRITAFAAEPDVQNPIDAAWDSKGRLWIAENYTYAKRSQKFQLDLRDRVVILDGTSGDKFTKRTVFTDDVQMLTSIEVGRGGVWMMCPPQVLFFPDADGDDVPDSDGEVVLDGFKVADANYHNFANGLRFGPDGWLYGRCGGSCPGRIGVPGTPDENRLAMEGGMWRYHPDTKAVEVLTTGTTNPWGHDWNAVGQPFFVNTVNGHLWHGIPGAHFTRPFTLDPNQKTYELIDFHADHWHFDTGAAWHESRDGVANSYGGGHAHSGTMIYQGGRWPKQYNGRLFTLNFHGRRANQEILERKGSGYVARHGEDTFLAADPWFRGMEITSGPDGNAFILDWSDAGECHEHTGVHRTSGRIFKVSYGDAPTERFRDDLSDWSDEKLAETLAHPNVWFQRQAGIEIAARRAKGKDVTEVRIAAKESFNEASDSAGRVQAMMMAYLSDTSQDWTNDLVHPDEHVRACAIRLISDKWPIDDAMGSSWKPKSQDGNAASIPQIRRLVTIAETDDSPLVQLTLASTLQRLHPSDRAILARSIVMHGEFADDHNLPLMVWYGLIETGKHHPEMLVDVAKNCQLPTTLRLISRSLTERIESNPGLINAVLEHVIQNNDKERLAIVLAGVSEALKGWRTAPKPEVWDRVAEVDHESIQPIVRELSVVFGDGRAMEELIAIVKGEGDPDADMRHAALETLIQSDVDELKSLCVGLLGDQRINVLAARGLSKFDDPEIGQQLVKRYRNFRAPQRPKLMSILVSRKAFAMPMLDAIEAGKIQRSDLSAFQARQINGLGDDELSARVAEVWGEVNDTPEATEKRIIRLKDQLNDQSLASANKSNGRTLFAKSCQNCHRLYGEGEKVGPDLTGANRNNLDYLLENIVAPSAVVDKDFRMTLILTEDGRVLSGLVTSETDKVIELQAATEKLTIAKEDVTSRKVTDKSPMPDGLLDQMSEDEIRDLISYLRHPSQVALKP